MTLEELTQILDRHGADAARWPQDIRAECEAFVASNSDARTLIEQQAAVEEILDKIAVPAFPGLESRVLHQSLPERSGSFFDPLLSWLIPREGSGPTLWRPALAACLPLVFGIVLANYFSFGVGVESDGFQYWGDELAMLSLTNDSQASL